MLSKCRLTGLAALGVLALAAISSGLSVGEERAEATAAKVSVPKIEDAKIASEEWYGLFLEGKNIGYERLQKGLGTVAGTKVYFQEEREKRFFEIDGASQTAEYRYKYVMKADSYEPMYFKITTDSPGFNYVAEGVVEKNGNTYTVQATKTMNGKTESRSKDIELQVPLYFQCGALEGYMRGPFKEGEDAPCCVLNTGFLDYEEIFIRCMGAESIKGVEGEIKCKRICIFGNIEFLVSKGGTVERVQYPDSEMEYRRADKNEAIDRTATIADYKTPDYLHGDTARVERLGIALTRTRPSQHFGLSSGYASLFVLDEFSDVMIECMVYENVPADTDYDKALVRIKGALPSSVLGKGKVLKTKAGECLTGAYSFNADKGLECAKGRYRIYINDGSIVLIIMSGRGDSCKEHKEAIEACLDTIKFSKPVLKDRSILRHVDYVTNIRMSRPSQEWCAHYYGTALVLSHPWSGAYGYGEIAMGAADPKTVYLQLKQNPGVSSLSKRTISGKKSIVLQYPEAKDNQIFVATRVYVFLADKTLVFWFYATKDRIGEVQQDIDAIIKSMEVVDTKNVEEN